VHDERFFRRALTGGDIGIGESFMDATGRRPTWSRCPVDAAHRRILESQGRITGALHRLAGGIARRLETTRSPAVAAHHRHYDLGNDFFRLFLDADLLMYSCGYFESAPIRSKMAQSQKIDPSAAASGSHLSDHVLEIGSGWGALRRLGVHHYGCR